MLQTCISHYKNLGAVLLLAAVLGNGHASLNVSRSGLATATPTATGHNHSSSWASLAASTTSLRFNSTTGEDGVSNGTAAAVTVSGLGSERTGRPPSVTAGGSPSAESQNTMSSAPAAIAENKDNSGDKNISNKNIGLGFFILIFLMVIIVLLIVVIWYIRKKTRQYSFDLYQKDDVDIPLSSVGQGGVFVPNQNDEGPADSENAAEDESDEGPGEGELQAGEERRGPEDVHSEKSDSFGSQIVLMPKEKPVELNFNLSDGEANQSRDTSTDTLGETQNENNNNAGGRLPSSPDFPTAVPSGAEIFTEISLDEPV